MFAATKFISWSVFGDGCVSVGTHNKNAHYSISRSLDHQDYLDLIQSKLEAIPNVSVNRTIYTRKGNGKTVDSLRTCSHPIFTRIRDSQYNNSRRVVNPHMLTMIDWEALAYLYMDDGSLCYNNKGSSVVRLSVCAYSYFEQEAVRKALIEKLGVCFNVNRASKGLYQLNLAKKDQEIFFDNIHPFIVDSYKYKLPTSLQEDAPTQVK